MTATIELSLLGALLDAEGPAVRSNAGALLDRAGLQPEWFSDRRVQTVWTIVHRLVQRRRPVSAKLVHAAGLASKQLTEADLDWLVRLQNSNDLDASRFADMAETLRGMRRSESLVAVLERAITDLRTPNSDMAAIAGSVETALRESVALGSPDSTGEADVLEIGAEWEMAEGPANIVPILPTGLQALDDVIGGWVANLNLIAGLPSVGKSALLGTIIDEQLKRGVKVGLFGLEDGTKWAPKRIIARDMAIPVRQVGTAKRTPEQALRSSDVMAETAARWRNCTTFTHDSITIDDLCWRATQWILERGVQVIYVDHIGEVDVSSSKHDRHDLRVGEAFRRLRNIALRYTVPMVVLSHTKRGDAQRTDDTPPAVQDLAESEYGGRRARVMLGVWSKSTERDVMRLSVLKATEGEKDVHLKLQRFTTAALIDPHSGERVDLFAERMAELRKKREEANAQRAEMKAKADAVKDAAKAQREAAKKAKAPQFTFVGGDE